MENYNNLIEGYKDIVKSLENQLSRNKDEYKNERMESLKIISLLWEELQKNKEELKFVRNILSQELIETHKIPKISEDNILLNSPR